MKTQALTLILALASTATFADSDTPVCRGQGFPKELQGAWMSNPSTSKADLIITESHMIYLDEETNTFKGSSSWYCKREGIEFIVSDFGPDAGPERYESRAIAGSVVHSSRERFILDLGEAYLTKTADGEKLEIYQDEKPSVIRMVQPK